MATNGGAGGFLGLALVLCGGLGLLGSALIIAGAGFGVGPVIGAVAGAVLVVVGLREHRRR